MTSTHEPVPVATPWLHKLPRVSIVDKDQYLAELVAGRSVIHAGFWGLADPDRRDAFEGMWLHKRLAESAANLVGIDRDSTGVTEARQRGYIAYAIDCQDTQAVRSLGISSDMVVAGELIEHLDCPGAFLRAMHSLSTTLVVTTPNAPSLLHFSMALANREAVNPDHVTLFSWYTLTNLLRRNGWSPQQVHVYDYARVQRGQSVRRSLPRAFGASLFLAAQRAIARVSPFTGYGLIVVARADQRAYELGREE